MGTDVSRIREYVVKHPDEVMTSLYHHVTDVDNLRASYEALDGAKAVGVDGVRKEEYGRELEGRLENLSQRLRDGGYRPQDKRRSYIPKPGSERGRPLAISAFEDKIVEETLKRVLEAVFEPMFLSCSHGYRKGKSQHGCLESLGKVLQQKRINHVVEADIRRYFDTVNHEWMKKFVKHRIGDPRILELIERMLKAGILEDGLTKANDEGTPQGSIISPILSNIYLHYVLDLWFDKRVKKQVQGEAYLFRFADDFVACFQLKEEAERFEKWLEDRLEGFGLQLAKEKTGRLEFGRYAVQNSQRRKEARPHFTFLGFTHYCGRTRFGHFKVKRYTSTKKFRQKMREFSEWVRAARGKWRTGEIVKRAKSRIEGHLAYYAVTDNGKRCGKYVYCITRLLFKWLNRRSQRLSYTWDQFNQMLTSMNWSKVRIRIDLNPFRA
jgi:RNA-directed DNA polymerase